MTIEEIKAKYPAGTILHTSWGYSMTINDFCVILENTGKTVKCQMLHSHGDGGQFGPHGGRVEPGSADTSVETFRLRIKDYGDTCVFRGSYPFAGNGTRRDTFAAHRAGDKYHECHWD